jgi:predicted acetyltransferase
LADVEIIDLKKDDFLIPRYVDLRNRYVQLLLTQPIAVAETKRWLLKEDIEVRCLLKNDVLLGAVILYLNRAGEIAFFVNEPKKGVGSKLLRVIEKVAVERGLRSVWAWVLRTNLAARKTFVKNGYRLEKESPKEYGDELLGGLIYRKTI